MACRRLGIEERSLPVLWDADFLLGERKPGADETFVLCEINVSSVAPYPKSANAPIVEAVKRVLAPDGCGR